MGTKKSEQCIALTNTGDRCSRVAKDSRFCFQHDESDETVEISDETDGTIVSAISDQIDIRPERFTGVQRDVAENIKDMGSDMGDISDSLFSGDISDSLSAFIKSARKTGGKAASGTIVGGVLGSPFGPAGVAAGSTAGAWYGVYRSVDDDRAIAAQVINSAPNDATVVDSDNDAITEVQPIQLAIQSATEQPEKKTEWFRNTMTRNRDMDQVSEALDKIASYQTENEATVYFIRHVGTDEILQVTFGVPTE